MLEGDSDMDKRKIRIELEEEKELQEEQEKSRRYTFEYFVAMFFFEDLFIGEVITVVRK